MKRINMLEKILVLVCLISLIGIASCGSASEQKQNEQKQNEQTIFVPKPEDVIRTGNGKVGWSFKTKTGVVLFGGRTFKMATEFAYGFSTVQIEKEGKILYGVINLKGEEVIPIEHESRIGAPQDGGYFIIQKDQKTGLINAKGELIIPIIYQLISARNPKYKQAFVKGDNGLWGSVAFNSGDTIAKFIYKKPGIAWRSDRIPMELARNKYVYLDPNGNPIHEGYFERAFLFNDQYSIALVQYNGKYGFINKKGEVEIDFLYSDYKQVADFDEDDLMRERGENWRYILEEGYIILEKNKKWGYINTKGDVVVPFEFDNIGILGKGSTLVSIVKNNEPGVFDIKEQKLTMNK